MDDGRIQNTVSDILSMCSGERILETVRSISRFHRIQASEGYRRAAKNAADILERAGLDVSVEEFPAKLGLKYLGASMFRSWSCSGAWLDVTSPWNEHVADFNTEELSLIQRSAPADMSCDDVPIVYMADGDYRRGECPELRGTILFVENHFEKWIDTALKSGVAAILTVSMPEIEPVRTNMADDPRLADARANLSFHPVTAEEERNLRGFALSPRLGARLKETCITLGSRGERPSARFKISSEFSDGTIENVNAVIKGETDEEVLVTAHLCHPRSCVNDNVSGTACAIEALSALREFLSRDGAPTLRRTVRLMLIPEFTGTYAYIARHPQTVERTLACFNLDMVGARQDGTAGPFIIVDTPDAANAFTGDLAEAVTEAACVKSAFGGGAVSMTNWARVPFAGGSDHEILSDPMVGVPAVAFTQWPDKTYHTSADDIFHLDAESMRRVAAVTAACCLLYANFDTQTAGETLPKTIERLRARSRAAARENEPGVSGKLAYMDELLEKTLASYEQAVPACERDRLADMVKREKTLAGIPENRPENAKPTRRKGPRPKRLYRAPITKRMCLAAADDAAKAKLEKLHGDFKGFDALDSQILYETDGSRTFCEIADRVKYSTGCECEEYVTAYLRLLSQLRLIQLDA